MASVAAHREALRCELEALRAALGGRDYVLDTFTWADIVLASIVQGFAPVEDRYVRLGEATRQIWTHPDLAEQFADLVAYRDRLYERHRSKTPLSRAG